MWSLNILILNFALSQLIQLKMFTFRKKNSVVQTYSNGFAGFAARLSEDEAKSIAQKPGVVSVFPDPVLQLHTTRSWDFLKYQTDLKIDSTPSSPSDSSSTGADTIIGILDTGKLNNSIFFPSKMFSYSYCSCEKLFL